MSTGTSGSTTTNFDLILPGYEDDTDVDDLNENFKTIDGELYDATQAIAQNASAIQTVQDSLSYIRGNGVLERFFSPTGSNDEPFGIEVIGRDGNTYRFYVSTTGRFTLYSPTLNRTFWAVNINS